ncbi:hypothetical protein IGI04_027299 [Brassica rapa subsp. trilocularis]|uniref:Uncharacterized protein n=1 Tax=Brassica rapa subsp. trilocularis TaxID=1813537 RepID=A0ABQ7KYT2_BRACM|nr:hypothetical protein IGI04_027299 [Brassica rapa subsp. trilocularis]
MSTNTSFTALKNSNCSIPGNKTPHSEEERLFDWFLPMNMVRKSMLNAKEITCTMFNGNYQLGNGV